MSKAEERALAAYPPEYGDEDFDKTWDSNEQYREPYQEGYEQAEKDIIAIIESRISEIIGDAQPKPILRAELQELITKIKEQ